MRRIGVIVAAVAAFVALVGIAAAVAPTDSPPATTSTTPPAPTTTAADQVLASIAALTDCAALQAAFDQADANHDPALARENLAAAERTVEIMKAADARMQQLGCS